MLVRNCAFEHRFSNHQGRLPHCSWPSQLKGPAFRCPRPPPAFEDCTLVLPMQRAFLPLKGFFNGFGRARRADPRGVPHRCGAWCKFGLVAPKHLDGRHSSTDVNGRVHKVSRLALGRWPAPWADDDPVAGYVLSKTGTAHGQASHSSEGS